MPTGSDEEGEVVFLSPDESPPKDQGASPQLRRSNRKRKSVTVQDMSKGSSSKKKKNSPVKRVIASPKGQTNNEENMPKVTRTPPKSGEGGTTGGQDVAALLLAMEERLSSKLDANKKAINEAVKLSKLNSDALDALEEKVDASDEILKETLARVEAQEDRVLARVEEQVREIVKEQLRAAGFDTQLSAGDLSTIQTRTQNTGSYAEAAAKAPNATATSQNQDRDQKREGKFWQCRRSLRLWPVPKADENGVKEFLKEKLAMDETFLNEDMGHLVVKRHMERRQRNKDEVCVEFETKQIRDMVKAQGPNLANYREEAGMRLQIPDNLQKDFKALMAVAYDMKKTNKEVRRNVKFDEEGLGLFMDIQTEKDGDWKRIRPQQAYKALGARATSRGGPAEMEEDGIRTLLETADDDE